MAVLVLDKCLQVLLDNGIVGVFIQDFSMNRVGVFAQ